MPQPRNSANTLPRNPATRPMPIPMHLPVAGMAVAAAWAEVVAWAAVMAAWVALEWPAKAGVAVAAGMVRDKAALQLQVASAR